MATVRSRPQLVTSFVIASRESDGVLEWMKTDGVSEQEVFDAVRAVGNSLPRVKAYIAERRRFEEQRSA